MRLWMKLVLIVGIAVGVQAWGERHAETLDRAAFVLRVGLLMRGPDGAPTEAMVAAAERLGERTVERYARAARRARGEDGAREADEGRPAGWGERSLVGAGNFRPEGASEGGVRNTPRRASKSVAAWPAGVTETQGRGEIGVTDGRRRTVEGVAGARVAAPV